MVLIALAVTAGSAEAWTTMHGHRFHGHRFDRHRGTFVGGFVDPFGYDAYPYVPYEPPVNVVVIQPPVVILTEPPPPPPPPPKPQGLAEWHYCESTGTHYPAGSACPPAWTKIAPSSVGGTTAAAVQSAK